jgi:hypothetical protein
MTYAVDPPALRARSRPLVLGVLASIALIATSVSIFQFVTSESRTAALARTRAAAEASRIAAQIDATLAGAVPIAEALARDLGTGDPGEAALARRLAAALGGDARLVAAGAAYRPGTGPAGGRLYAPFVRGGAGAPALKRLDAEYDYTQVQYGWFGDTLLDGAHWTLLTLESGSDAVAGFVVPFYAPTSNPKTDDPRGVAFVAVPLDIVSRAMEGFQLSGSGYAFAFARDGRYLSHPRRELVEERQSIFQTAWETGNTALNSMAIHAVKGERGSVEALEPLTGERDWIFYEPIKSTGWTVASVFPRRDFQPADNMQRRQLFLLVLLAVTTIALVASTLVRLTPLGWPQRLWVDAVVVSLLLSGGIGALWWVADRHAVGDPDIGRQLLDGASVEQFLLTHATRDRSGERRPLIRVPTGVFVRTIAFQSGTDVVVTGYVWQRYTAGTHDGVARGFTLPEAEQLQNNQVTELYRSKTGSEERIGWQFTAKIRQEFSYARYPFDRENVWVRIRPLDFRPDVVLVPDFEGYPIMNPAALPGVARDLVLPGWQVLGSYFDYRLRAYNASFGVRSYRALDEAPELYFNVALRRLFIGPFVSSIVPLSVAVAMLFSVLVISTRREKSKSLFGFSAADTLRSCAALFFVVSFQHVALRNQLASPVLMYFEYFYFTVYVAILAVSVDAILFAAQFGFHVIEHNENMYPKLLFWPLWSGWIFAITYVALY